VVWDAVNSLRQAKRICILR